MLKNQINDLPIVSVHSSHGEFLKTSLFFFFFLGYVSAQVNIVAHYSNLNDSTLMALEKDIIENVVRLHNIKEKEPMVLQFKKHRDFTQVFKALESESSKNTALVINSVTITPSREIKYDFSIPYLPVNQVLIANSTTPKNEPLKGNSIGYVVGSIQERFVPMFTTDQVNAVAFPNFKLMGSALLNHEITFMLADNVGVWSNEGTYIFKFLETDYAKSYGIMYPKGSELKQRLNKYLAYYLRSSGFHRLLKKAYTKEIADYMLSKLRVY